MGSHPNAAELTEVTVGGASTRGQRDKGRGERFFFSNIKYCLHHIKYAFWIYDIILCKQ